MAETIMLVFSEGEDIILPDTHEWIDITTMADRARKEAHFIQGLEKTEKCAHCGSKIIAEVEK